MAKTLCYSCCNSCTEQSHKGSVRQTNDENNSYCYEEIKASESSPYRHLPGHAVCVLRELLATSLDTQSVFSESSSPPPWTRSPCSERAPRHLPGHTVCVLRELPATSLDTQTLSSLPALGFEQLVFVISMSHCRTEGTRGPEGCGFSRDSSLVWLIAPAHRTLSPCLSPSGLMTLMYSDSSTLVPPVFPPLRACSLRRKGI